MRNKQITVYTLALACLFSLATTHAGEPPSACVLYSKNDVKVLFNHDVKDGVSRKTVMPAGNSCQYLLQKDGEAYTFRLRVSHSDEIKNEGMHASAADVMKRQEEARMNNPYAAKKFQKIQNLGTDAFWNGEDLWVLQDGTLLIISIHAPLDGSFPDMQALHQARAEHNKTLSLQVAKTVLTKLN